MFRIIIPIFVVLTLLLSACSTQLDQQNSGEKDPSMSGSLVIYSGRSEPLIQPVLSAFQEKYPEVELLLKSGSNSQLANALIEEKANPQADIFITTEIFTAHALSQEGLFQPYEPVGYESIPSKFKAEDATWIGLTQRLRVIMYNKDLINQDELPNSMFDLLDPKWKGQIASAGSTNASFQAQVASMIQLIGKEQTKEWVNGLLANDVTFFGEIGRAHV